MKFRILEFKLGDIYSEAKVEFVEKKTAKVITFFSKRGRLWDALEDEGEDYNEVEDSLCRRFRREEYLREKRNLV